MDGDGDFVNVFVKDELIPPQWWGRIRLKQGELLRVEVIPRGGGGSGKMILRIVAVIAIAVFAYVAAPFIVGGLVSGGFLAAGASTLATGIIAAGITLVGTLALNALIPIKGPDSRGLGNNSADAPVFGLTGTQNQANPFGVIPQVLGRHRMFPVLAAAPFTELVGSDQYLRMLFTCGYGPITIEDLRIGETPIAQFQGVELEVDTGIAQDSAPITLYTQRVSQENFAVVVTKTGGAVQRTTPTETTGISVELTFARGLVKFDAAGNKTETQVELVVEYKAVASSTWSVADSAVSISGQSVTADSVAANVGTKGVYYRTDLVLLDRFTGVASIKLGQAYMRSSNTDGHAADVPDSAKATPPYAADRYWLLSKVVRQVRNANDINTTTITTVTDERTAELKAFDPGNEANTFKVTTNTSSLILSVAAGKLKNKLLFTGAASQVIRKDIHIDVVAGQYDVRVRRLTDDATDSLTFNEVTWTTLRAFRTGEPVLRDNVTLIALRIKASEQLNGVVNNFNLIATSVCPDYDEDSNTWITKPTTNPASLYRHILQGNANARPLANIRLDLDTLQDWHTECEEKGFEFSAVIDSPGTLFQRLNTVAAVGRASFNMRDGRFSVVRDLAQASPVQHYTPRNSRNLSGSVIYHEQPHALRVSFINRDKSYAADEITVYDDGYNEGNATKFEQVELFGVTTSTHAHKLGRYHIAVGRLRNESWEIDTDFEHLVCTRGDRVQVTHDVPLVGLGQGRVKAITTLGDSSFPSLVLEFSPNLYYRFSEGGPSTMVDASDNHYDGAYFGPVDFNFSSGLGNPQSDSAIFLGGHQFDGDYEIAFSAPYGRASANALLSLTTQISIVLFFNPNGTGDTVQTLVSKANFADLEVDYEITYNKSTGKVAFTVGDSSDATDTTTVTSTGTVNPSEWSMVTAVYDGTNIKIYINNVIQGTALAPSAIADTGGDLYVGITGANDDSSFEGLIDELAIFNGVLDDDDVNDLYEAAAMTGSGPLVRYVLDEKFTQEDGKSYGVRLRDNTGATNIRTVTTVPGKSNVLLLTSAIDSAKVGDLLMFGEAGRESVSMLVKAIEIRPDLSAHLTLIPEAPGVLTADEGLIPTYDSNITQPSELRTLLDGPSIQQVTIFDLRGGSSRTFGLHIIVTPLITKAKDGLDTYAAEIRLTGSDQWTNYTAVPSRSGVVSVMGVEPGKTYDVHVRGTNSRTGMVTRWREFLNVTITPEQFTPINITTLNISDLVLSWDYTPSIDLHGFKIRWQNGTTGVTWETAQDLVTEVFTNRYDLKQHDWSPGTYTFLVKPISVYGQEAATAVSLSISIGDLQSLEYGTADEVDEKGGGFTGTKTHCTVVSGDLKASVHFAAVGGDDTPMWGSDGGSLAWTGDGNDEWSSTTDIYYGMEYISNVVNPPSLGVGRPVRMELDYTIAGTGVRIQYREDGGDWIDFPGGAVADVKDSIDYEIRVTTQESSFQGIISKLKILFTAKVIEERVEDFVTAATTGTRLSLSTSFYTILQVGGLAVQLDGNGGTYALVIDKNPSTGPLIKVFNSSNAVVQGLIDAVVRGI